MVSSSVLCALLLAVPSLALTGCFDATLPAAPLACGVSTDCPEGLGCFQSRCVALNACLDDDGAAFAVRADGTVCGEGICIAGVCQAAVCGDGVVSGNERCDSDPGCRDDCTRCGEDVIFAADGSSALGALDDATRCISGVAVIDDHTVWLADRCV